MTVKAEGLSIEVDLPVRIVSEMNTRQHAVERNKRFKAQKKAVYYTLVGLRRFLAMIAEGHGPIRVTFTRFGPRLLDSDNLASGFKACRDQVAAMLGINDGDRRITWDYQQWQARTYSARVLIERRSV